MEKISCIILILLSTCMSCAQEVSEKESQQIENEVLVENKPERSLIHPKGKDLKSRFRLPEGYERVDLIPNTFAYYLRKLPLKAYESPVLYYDGREKNRQVYESVVDLPIGNRDLHQCADAVMRLWAEHHFQQKQFEKIHFNFTNGFRVDYSEWRKGKRIVVKGNKSYWSQSANPSDSYKSFWKYMEIIFSYAGTLSLEKELIPVDLGDLQIGDVFIQGGSPGHAVIVVDMAEHTQSKEKIFMLAQSYMPAQEIQVLKNLGSETLNPWYTTDFGETLETPEWTFRKSDLRRFP